MLLALGMPPKLLLPMRKPLFAAACVEGTRRGVSACEEAGAERGIEEGGTANKCGAYLVPASLQSYC